MLNFKGQGFSQHAQKAQKAQKPSEAFRVSTVLMEVKR